MKPINHRDFTCAALQVFEKKTGVTVPIDIKKMFIQASDDEDNAAHEFFQRGFNWHFYNNNNDIVNKKWPGIRTSEKRIGKLIDRVDKYLGRFNKSPKELNAMKLLDTAGRLAHHIQDMRTPTHVVPVYHGPGNKDEYETYIGKLAGKIKVTWHTDSSQDNANLITITATDIEKHASAIANHPTPSEEPLHKLHISSAELCLKYLREKNFKADLNGQPQEGSIPLTKFWVEHPNTDPKPKHDGFGDFGTFGNNFGKANIPTDIGEYTVEDAQYRAIYKDLFKQSVLDTLVIIYYLQERSEILTYQEPLIDQDSLNFPSDYDEIGKCPQ